MKRHNEIIIALGATYFSEETKEEILKTLNEIEKEAKEQIRTYQSILRKVNVARKNIANRSTNIIQPLK
jgi:prefoldin subunit 5